MRGFNHSITAIFITVALLLTAGILSTAAAQVSAFSYQGILKDNGQEVTTDRARFLFRLYDAPTLGHPIGPDNELTSVDVVEGIFTVFLDFGSTAFNGNVRYLEIGVDVSGGTNYNWLDPRQPITPAPYALHALHGGDNPWTINGTDLTYTAGEIGIGTESPTAPLSVEASGEVERVISGVHTGDFSDAVGVYGEVNGPDAIGAFGRSASTIGGGYGVYGNSSGENGKGVYGYAGHTSGATNGVTGKVRSPAGMGVYGLNLATSGNGVGVYGEATSSSGFGGYFLGKGYFSGRLGIGTTSPNYELEVAGTVQMDGFKLDSAAQSGYVLTSDASGSGTWQPASSGGGFWQASGSDIYYNDGDVGIGTVSPTNKLDVVGTVEMSGFKLTSGASFGEILTCDSYGNGTWQPAPSGGGLNLPYDDSVSSSTPAFKVTNTGTGVGSHAIMGVINNTNSNADAAAGSFNANGSNGYAITAFSDARPGVYSDHNGPNWAFWGTSEGAGAGYFSSTGYQGHGVEGTATGEQGHGVYATASGGGAAIYTEATGASGIGIYAKGSTAAGRFNGNVDIYEYGTNNKVMELGKGLDYAEGFDVTEADEADIPKGTVLVIDPNNPGHLTRCSQAYDNKVAGIIAGANGLGSGVRLGPGEFDHDVALAGRVYCNVVAIDGDIQPGDLLTTSSVPGYAMKVRDHSRAQGAVLGKAMEPLEAGQKGQILVLVTLQ